MMVVTFRLFNVYIVYQFVSFTFVKRPDQDMGARQVYI